jgi:CRISPR-associated protein Csb3
MSSPNIQIPVDLTNPGQFFACCGLLELADRLWTGAEGWFVSHDLFALEPGCNGSIEALLSSIIYCKLNPLIPAEDLAELRDLEKRKNERKRQGGALTKELGRRRKALNSKRIAAGFCLGPPFNLRVDWWLADDCDGAHLATWAGQQAISEIADDLKHSLKKVPTDELLEHESLIERQAGGPPRAPLGFDAGRVGTAQDIGYSADKVGQSIACCIWTEFLGLIGIQRFALKPDEEGYFTYAAWHSRFPVVAACVAARGLIPGTVGAAARFRLAGRDNEGRYKAFQQATVSEWRPK